jgi:uncharacterized protein YjiS (DUF1127 family)
MAATVHFSRAGHLPSAFGYLVAAAKAGVRKFSRTVKNRRRARMLAGMDDRMLADIGLNRSDLRDAYAQPLWRDPTDMLAGRVREKQFNRRGSIDVSLIVAPGIVPEDGFRRPRTDRPARHTI